jgi:RimJ/RimL family protein N-acetyltransferase
VAVAGYWTVAERRGGGLTGEALRVLRDWAFEGLGARRFELIADPANTASRRVAESAGLRAEGVLRSRRLHRGVPGRRPVRPAGHGPPARDLTGTSVAQPPVTSS